MKRAVWLAFLLLGAWDPVTRKHADVAKGNERLAAGKPTEAETQYKKALGELPSNPGVLYDLGAAHYLAAQALPAGEDRKKLLDSAEKELRLAGDAPETGLRASAHYNLGNTLYAEDKFKDAIEEYKKALRLEPGREDARHNLELALARIPPPPPQQQPQSSKDDQKKPQGGESQEPSPPSASQDKKDQKPDDQPGQAQDKDDSQKPPDPKDQKQAGQEPKPNEQKPEEPRDKQAAQGGEQAGDKDMDRKLDLLEDRSKDLQVQKAQEHARERRRKGPVKDW